MEFAVLLGLLLLKHAITSHWMDVGYSHSRDPDVKRWYLWLYLQALIEAVFTVTVGFCYGWPAALIAVSIEHGGVVFSALVERAAPYHAMIQYHVLSELGVLILYVIIVFKLVV